MQDQLQDHDEQHDDGPARDPEYTESSVSAYGSNADARQAFREMQIKPSRTKRSSALGKRFKEPAFYHYGSSVECFQWPNGAGLMERTNRQNRGGRQLRCQDGDSLDGIGVDQLYRFINGEDLHLSEVVTSHSNDFRGNVAIEFEDGTFVVVLYDSSANARQGSRRAGMLVRPDDPLHTQVDRYVGRGDLDALSDLVAPDDVLASDMDVIDSQSYRSGDGWRTPDHEGGYGDEEMLGNAIIRQGEWYFIPEPDFSPDGEVLKPLSENVDNPLGSHKPRDLVVEDDEIFVRGTVRHQRNEHAMFNLYETWHRVVENTEDMYVFEGRRGGRWE